MAQLRFTALGHVTNDILTNSRSRSRATGIAPGGSVLYAAIAAARLGASARIHTSHGPDFVGSPLLDDISVDVLPAERTTCFENVYDDDGRRRQRVHAIASPLTQPIRDADIVFACPVVGEVQASALVTPAGGILALGLQGWLRSIGPDGIVSRRPVGELTVCSVIFCSDEDLGDSDAAATTLPYLRTLAPIVVVTEGARGAVVHTGAGAHRVHAHPATEVDPTGAGDVFAAAFLVSLAGGAAPLDAAVVAVCAASIVVEGTGPAPLERMQADLPGRMAWHRMNAPRPSRI